MGFVNSARKWEEGTNFFASSPHIDFVLSVKRTRVLYTFFGVSDSLLTASRILLIAEFDVYETARRFRLSSNRLLREPSHL